MLQLDLGQSWDWQKNISWKALETTPNPKTGASVRPAMVIGSLFHGSFSSPDIWTYGGTIFRGNDTFLDAVNPDAFHDQSNIYPLWSFDNDKNTWDQFDIGTLTTPNYGSSAEAPDQGLAFYLHGRTDNGTNIGAKNSGDVQTLLDGMIVIDLVSHTSNNISTASMKDPQPRLGGGLQYVPGIGESGILVALGGKVFDGLEPVTSQSQGRLLGFDDVDVFDLASYSSTRGNDAWFTQSTSGDVPPSRIDFCTVLASAPDNSSHNIYMYGGWDPTSNQTRYYDDIYVLSLPSFTWTKMFKGESPRYGHTCHLAAGRQLLTIGGSTQHGNITDSCDWEAESVGIMDLPSMTWGSVFTAGYRPYELSNNLIQKLGGTAQGNASLIEPVQGWASERVKNVMRTSRIYSNFNGTIDVIRPAARKLSMSSRNRTIVIATVTVVGTLFFFCITWLAYLKRKRRNKVQQTDNSRTTIGPCFEVEEKAKFELSPNGKQIYEMAGEGYVHEATDGTVRVEADRANMVVSAIELPVTDFNDERKWGTSLVNVPIPTMSSQDVGIKDEKEKGTELGKNDGDIV